jgi:hypothetical protein
MDKIIVKKVAMKGKNLWRVQVGNFADKNKAEHALKLVHNAGVADAHIIHN